MVFANSQKIVSNVHSEVESPNDDIPRWENSENVKICGQTGGEREKMGQRQCNQESSFWCLGARGNQTEMQSRRRAARDLQSAAARLQAGFGHTVYSTPLLIVIMRSPNTIMT